MQDQTLRNFAYTWKQ